jgi:dolichol-phosphate mannosyltransferase
VVLVDDGSTDGSTGRCDEIAAARPEVEVIHFPSNRGKTEALAAGFARAAGDVVITLDSDLQDDPAEIPRFLEAIAQGLDLVCGWKVRRQDPWSKRCASRLYNGATARVFGLRLHDINCGFKAMRIEVARAAVLKHDYHRLIPAIAAAQGFRVGEIAVRHHPRRHGTSKFGLERYWRGLRDVGRLWWEIQRGRIGRVVPGSA